MKKKEEKKDILAEILNGSEDEVIDGLEELCKIISLESISFKESSASRENAAPVKKTRKKPVRKQVSHYLTEKVLEELGETKSELRELFPSMPKSKVTKSRIVDLALKTILEEYKQKGLESKLIRRLMERMADY